MSKELSAKYYQVNKEGLHENLVKVILEYRILFYEIFGKSSFFGKI